MPRAPCCFCEDKIDKITQEIYGNVTTNIELNEGQTKAKNDTECSENTAEELQKNELHWIIGSDLQTLETSENFEILKTCVSAQKVGDASWQALQDKVCLYRDKGVN